MLRTSATDWWQIERVVQLCFASVDPDVKPALAREQESCPPVLINGAPIYSLGDKDVKRRSAVTLTLVFLTASALFSFGQVQETIFNLTPQQKFLPCLARPGYTPTAQVLVQRGVDNDVLILRAQNLKPNLAFDLFTIQNSNLLADGLINPNFTNFGLAWYQSDLQADSNGNVDIAIKTILLDQIFGFDPAVALTPTNTFHVGFWFNDPNAAAACRFNPNNPTPLNGQHKAGPNAMISLPNSVTNLGPLCTAPEKQGNTFVCNINQ